MVVDAGKPAVGVIPRGDVRCEYDLLQFYQILVNKLLTGGLKIACYCDWG
jgi:hypothetical protein